MYNPQQPPKISIADRKALDFFAQDAFPPIEVNADNLISVKINSRFELIELRIWQDAAAAPEMPVVEQAILKAVNTAIREVAERNGQRLNQFSAELRKD